MITQPKIDTNNLAIGSLYDSKDTFVANFDNELEWIDLLTQIAEQSLEGYYFKTEPCSGFPYTVRIDVNKYGVCKDLPEGFYGQTLDMTVKLVKIRMNKKKEEVKQFPQ